MNTPGKSNVSSRRKSYTPYGNRRRESSGCFAPFKSPCSHDNKTASPRRSDNQRTKASSKVELAREVVELQEQSERLDEEIEALSKDYSQDKLPQYIDKLHEYNEIKDIAQMLIGKIAEKKGTTTKSLYPHFNLALDD